MARMVVGTFVVFAFAMLTRVCADGGDGAAMPVPPTCDPVTFPAAGEDAPALEGELSIPQRPRPTTVVPGAAICHPDPLMGGTMGNPVVLELRDRLLELGIATLRFNFRGTGASEGKHDDGRGEVDDVLGALAFLRAQPAVDAARCGLAAYSFGSAMALKACARDEAVPACACVGFPTGLEPVAPEDFAYLNGLELPILFITGTRDQYSSVPNIMELVERYDLNARLVPMEGVDHFFFAPEKMRLMGIQAAQFLSQQLLGEL